jgi:hypothetical protein
MNIYTKGMNYYLKAELGIVGENVQFDWDKSAYIVDGEYHYVDEWKPINVKNDKDNYIKSRYEVNRKGEIRRISNKRKLQTKGKGSGYVGVHTGNRKFLRVHIAVLATFVGYSSNPKKNECNHDDLDKTNNCLFNLYWITRKDNNDHYLKMSGRGVDYKQYIGNVYGKGDSKFKVLSAECYSVIIEFLKTGNQKELVSLDVIHRQPVDNYYIITDPDGVEYKTDRLNCFRDRINQARFSEILLGRMKSYKGWTVRRDTNNKII